MALKKREFTPESGTVDTYASNVMGKLSPWNLDNYQVNLCVGAVNLKIVIFLTTIM